MLTAPIGLHATPSEVCQFIISHIPKYHNSLSRASGMAVTASSLVVWNNYLLLDSIDDHRFDQLPMANIRKMSMGSPLTMGWGGLLRRYRHIIGSFTITT